MDRNNEIETKRIIQRINKKELFLWKDKEDQQTLSKKKNWKKEGKYLCSQK
jgi:hypothetical protein